ncbi:MAG: hypothetical protein M9918_17550, partial [Anaerolineae bacterium]|nr:hypothetical protein [Anaerolineae bacterium]
NQQQSGQHEEYGDGLAGRYCLFMRHEITPLQVNLKRSINTICGGHETQANWTANLNNSAK